MTNHVLGLVNVELLWFSHTTTDNMIAKNQSGDRGFLNYFLIEASLNEFRHFLYKSCKMCQQKKRHYVKKKKKDV